MPFYNKVEAKVGCWRERNKVLYNFPETYGRRMLEVNFVTVSLMGVYLGYNGIGTKSVAIARNVLAVVIALIVNGFTVYMIVRSAYDMKKKGNTTLGEALDILRYSLILIFWMAAHFSRGKFPQVMASSWFLRKQGDEIEGKPQSNFTLSLFLFLLLVLLLFYPLIFYFAACDSECIQQEYYRHSFQERNNGTLEEATISISTIAFTIIYAQYAGKCLFSAAFAMFYTCLCLNLKSALVKLQNSFSRSKEKRHPKMNIDCKATELYRQVIITHYELDNALSPAVFIFYMLNGFEILVAAVALLGAVEDGIFQLNVIFYFMQPLHVISLYVLSFAASEVWKADQDLRRCLQVIQCTKISWLERKAEDLAELLKEVQPLCLTGWDMFILNKPFLAACTGTLITHSLLLVLLSYY